MNPKMKSALSIGFIVVSIAAVIVIAFSNQELGDAWAAISRLNIGWVAGIALCWWVYTFFESFSTWLYLRGQGYRIAVLRMLAITLLGFFYSNITPSAAGGQPMQVNAMRKAGIPGGGHAEVFLGQYGDARILLRSFPGQGKGSVCAAVVDNDDLQMLPGLLPDTGQHPGQRLFRIVHGYDDADQRPILHGDPFLSDKNQRRHYITEIRAWKGAERQRRKSGTLDRTGEKR